MGPPGEGDPLRWALWGIVYMSSLGHPKARIRLLCLVKRQCIVRLTIIMPWGDTGSVVKSLMWGMIQRGRSPK